MAFGMLCSFVSNEARDQVPDPTTAQSEIVSDKDESERGN